MENQPVKKAHSGLSIVAFVFSLTIILSIVGVVLAIIDLVKKNPEKKHVFSFIALGVGGLMTILLFVSCVSNMVNGTAETSVLEAVTAKPIMTAAATEAPTAEPTEAPTDIPGEVLSTELPSENEKSTPVVSRSTLATMIQGIGEENFDYCTVSFDDAGFTMNISNNGIAEAIVSAKAQGYDETYEAWVNMKNNMVGMSESTLSAIQEAGYPNDLFCLNVLNDTNKDNVLLSIINGIVVYDVMKTK